MHFMKLNFPPIKFHHKPRSTKIQIPGQKIFLIITSTFFPPYFIVAILFFGGIWGFWGVFFAIPLASLVQAVLTAWPRISEDELLET